MINFADIFKPETEKERIKADKQAQEKINVVGDIARACLQLEQFNHYKRQYEAAEEKIVSAMMMCTQSYLAGRYDLVSYGSQMLVYMTRMKDLRSLLDVVQSDAKKGKKDEKHED